MNDYNDIILTLLLLVPLAGAIVIAILPDRARIPNWIALLTSLVTLGFTLHLPAHFVTGQPGFQFEVNTPWIENPAIFYHVGVDSLSMWLVVLTGLLAPVGVLASWNAIETRRKLFYSLFLVQQTAILGVFVSLDLMLYYGFWELSLVPMAVLIAMFGRNRGPQAALKFFLYTFLPSALFLVAIIWLYAKTGTFDFVELQSRLAGGGFAPEALAWVSLAFLVAFAVKVPVFPLHGWLADAIQEAPTAMAMVIAGKLGLYSILRFNLGLFPVQARAIAPLMIVVAVVGLLYGALVALAQSDMRRLIAYSILSHLSFCTLGIFCFALAGLNGAVYQTINEGLTGGALLVLVSLIYERYDTCDMSMFGGLAGKLPMLATLYVITSLALVGLPLFNGFVGEFLVLSGGFPVHPGWVAAATVGVILSASYMLWMVQRIFYGRQSSLVVHRPALDLNAREHIMLWPMAVLMLAMGVLSPYWIKGIETGVGGLANAPAATARATFDAAHHGQPARTEAVSMEKQ